MKDFDFKIFPIYVLAFIRASMAFGVGLAIPLYFSTLLSPDQIGFIVSATALSYLFSPYLFRNVPKKIGMKNTLIVSFGGFLMVQIGFQISLNPIFTYLILFLDGIFLGICWPVLINAVSKIAAQEGVNIDKINRNYGFSWNFGGIFGYLLSFFVLFVISDILLIFDIALIQTFIGFVVLIFFKEPKSSTHLKNENSDEKNLKLNSEKRIIKFPLFIPLFIIGLFAFLLGSFGLIFPLKATNLKFELFTTYLFNFIRMSAQTILVTLAMSLSFKSLKRVMPFVFLILGIVFFIIGLTESLIVCGIVFAIIGINCGFLYCFSFKLTVIKNISSGDSKASVYYETIVGLNFLMGPIIAGIIATESILLAFYMLVILILISMVIYLLVQNKIKIEEKSRTLPPLE